MSDFIATSVMSVGLLFYMFGSTRISEFSDIRKCLNTSMYQALAFLASKNAAEVRNIKNPIHVYKCIEENVDDVANIKWYPYSSLVKNGKPDMGKIGQIGFECYEANFHYDGSTKLPSLEKMMMVLRKSPDCQIDISEVTEKEIINEYKFIVSLKKQAD